jgi:hypothetical protein
MAESKKLQEFECMWQSLTSEEKMTWLIKPRMVEAQLLTPKDPTICLSKPQIVEETSTMTEGLKASIKDNKLYDWTNLSITSAACGGDRLFAKLSNACKYAIGGRNTMAMFFIEETSIFQKRIKSGVKASLMNHVNILHWNQFVDSLRFLFSMHYPDKTKKVEQIVCHILLENMAVASFICYSFNYKWIMDDEGYHPDHPRAIDLPSQEIIDIIFNYFSSKTYSEGPYNERMNTAMKYYDIDKIDIENLTGTLLLDSIFKNDPNIFDRLTIKK